jgi:hypothetical protein
MRPTLSSRLHNALPRNKVSSAAMRWKEPDLRWDGGDPGRIRTCDLQLRRLLLYPLSYGAPMPPVATVTLLYRIAGENAQ